jgi:hypothetical protein
MVYGLVMKYKPALAALELITGDSKNMEEEKFQT